MSQSMRHQIAVRQSSVPDPAIPARSASTDLELWLTTLRQAMSDTGWTSEALDAHWGTSRGYANRLVNGEKSWSVERMLALPDDLEARLEHLRAEGFGRIVVEPICHAEGVKALVAGLVSVLCPRLPARTTGPIKADLPLTKKAVNQ